MNETTQDQEKKQWEPVDNLRPHQFKPGQSGNPGGRKKGSKSLKVFIREYLESLTDEEKLEYMKGMDKIDLFKMAEGNPHSTTDNKTELITPQPILGNVQLNNSTPKDNSTV